MSRTDKPADESRRNFMKLAATAAPADRFAASLWCEWPATGMQPSNCARQASGRGFIDRTNVSLLVNRELKTLEAAIDDLAIRRDAPAAGASPVQTHLDVECLVRKKEIGDARPRQAPFDPEYAENGKIRSVHPVLKVDISIADRIDQNVGHATGRILQWLDERQPHGASAAVEKPGRSTIPARQDTCTKP